jgi:hypothetical protein
MIPLAYQDENNHWICTCCQQMMEMRNGYLECTCGKCDCKVKMDQHETE